MRAANVAGPVVSVIIPTRDRLETLSQSLRSVYAQTYRNVEAIVIDNGSEDQAYAYVAKNFPRAKVIRAPQNLGVARALNIGISESSGDYFLFFNDKTVLHSRAIEMLVGTASKRPDIGALAAVIYFLDNPNVVFATGTRTSMVSGFSPYIRQIGKPEVFQVPYTTGNFLTSRKVIDDVGLFDERFFVGFEDADMLVRIKRHGYRLACVRTAKMWSKYPMDKLGRETKVMSRTYWISRNRLLFVRKNSSPIQLVLFSLLFLPLYPFYYSLRALGLGRIDLVVETWRGLLDGLRYRIARSPRTAFELMAI